MILGIPWILEEMARLYSPAVRTLGGLFRTESATRTAVLPASNNTSLLSAR